MTSAGFILWARKVPVLSHALRWCAGQYEENSVVRIKRGCAAGLLWRRHHRYINGYWLGSYEMPIQKALCRELRPGETFFDIGANAGFFTLIAAKLVGLQGRCIAFDPAPSNCDAIREQINANSLNHCCTVIQEAISDRDGTASFSFAVPGSPMGHLGAGAKGECEMLVKTLTLDRACERLGKPDFIKIDIEGAEGTALAAARETLGNIRPRFLIELHGAECERQVRRVLTEANYRLLELSGRPIGSGAPLPHHVIAKPAGFECK
jgi:FkbM family methyltransferase